MSTTLTTLALSAIIALTGCASGTNAPDLDPERPYQGSTDFSAHERELIEQGAMWTASHTGHPITITWVDHPQGDRLILREHLPTLIMGHTAVTPDGGAVIRLDLWQYQDREHVTSAHEFGHALGLSHHDGDGLMSPYLYDPASLEWTDGDLAGCVSALVCAQ